MAGGEGAGERERGPKRFGTGGPLKVSEGSKGPLRSSALMTCGAPIGPGGLGGRVSLALGLGGPQSPALRRQAPWEGPFGGGPSVRVSLEAGSPDPPALLQVEGWAEVKALASGSVGPNVLVQEAFEGHRGLGGSFTFSSTKRPAVPLVAWLEAWQQGEFGDGARGSPIPVVAAPGPLGGAPRGRTLG